MIRSFDPRPREGATLYFFQESGFITRFEPAANFPSGPQLATSGRRPGRSCAFRRLPKPTRCTRSRPSGDRDASGAVKARLCTSDLSGARRRDPRPRLSGRHRPARIRRLLRQPAAKGPMDYLKTWRQALAQSGFETVHRTVVGYSVTSTLSRAGAALA